MKIIKNLNIVTYLKNIRWNWVNIKIISTTTTNIKIIFTTTTTTIVATAITNNNNNNNNNNNPISNLEKEKAKLLYCSL